MTEDIGTFLENLSQTLRPADFIDVALVALFFYALISWLRVSTTSGTPRRIAVVVVLYSAVYLPARFLEMHLVGRVAEIFFIALILAVIVVFQSDLRRMLDQAGTWMFSGSSPADDSSPVDQLVESATRMAEERTGALIVLRGMEPWEQHIQGGVKLGGRVSPPLLYSIFDHRTPGHDGALLMEGSEIVRFAAHLPLTEDEADVSGYGGTRHAAALGMSQRCDAFVIVVSEERGTVSVAHDGNLQEVEAPGELKERLEAFWRDNYGGDAGGGRSWISKISLQTAAVSLVLAASLWLIFAYSPGTIHRSFEVPIEYRNVPADWMIEGGEQWADITISGPEQAFRLINPERMAIGLDMENIEAGMNEFPVDRGDIDLPQQLTLEVVQPQTLQVNARPLRQVRVPVRVSTDGELPDGLQLSRLESVPDSVNILVLESVEDVPGIFTEAVDLNEITEDTNLERPLVLSANMRFPPNANTDVEVQIEVEDLTDEDG